MKAKSELLSLLPTEKINIAVALLQKLIKDAQWAVYGQLQKRAEIECDKAILGDKDAVIRFRALQEASDELSTFIKKDKNE